MPNLLHIMHYAPKGTRTFDQFIVQMAKDAIQQGWTVKYVFSGEPGERFKELSQEIGFDWIVLPMPITWSTLSDIKRSWVGFYPTVILTSFITTYTLPLLWAKLSGWSRRLVICDHSSGTIRRTGLIWRLLRRLRGFVVGLIIDAIRPVSHFVAKRDIEQMYLPAKKVHVVWNGIDVSRFPFSKRDHDAPLRIAYAGQLIPEKGVDVLLRALKQLKDLGIQFEGKIAGAGSDAEQLSRLASEFRLAEVAFLGHVPTIPELFAWADIVVIPSLWAEAFGYVAAEAMSTGAVVIAADSGGLPEVIGDAGVIVPAGNVEELAYAISSLSSDAPERERLGKLASNRVREHFLIEQSVAGMLSLVNNIASLDRQASSPTRSA
jgi:glycosyltransferase involved in cell wall biosynthesis